MKKKNWSKLNSWFGLKDSMKPEIICNKRDMYEELLMTMKQYTSIA